MFFDRGWGHGVGMCQVGAYGRALDGATYAAILKKVLQEDRAEKTLLTGWIRLRTAGAIWATVSLKSFTTHT